MRCLGGDGAVGGCGEGDIQRLAMVEGERGSTCGCDDGFAPRVRGEKMRERSQKIAMGEVLSWLRLG